MVSIRRLVPFCMVCALIFCFSSAAEDGALTNILSQQRFGTSSSNNNFHIYCRDGEAKSLLKIWTRIALRFTFNKTTTYELYEGRTASEVRDMYNKSKKSWLPFYMLNNPDIVLNPFNMTCVGVVTDNPFTWVIDHKHVYSAYLACTLAAIVLFCGAGRLSKNVVFYYGAGVGIGVLASVLILCFLLGRLIPSRVSGSVIFLAGISSFITALQYIWKTQIIGLLDKHLDIVLGYLSISGLFSFVFVYWYGAPQNPRTLDIVKWVIQVFSLLLIYNSIQIQELGIVGMVLLVTIYNLQGYVLRNLSLFWQARYPVERRLLTMDEYDQQGYEFTSKALDELRSYCKSPECNAWTTISRLNSPMRFADFVEGSSHLTDDELLCFESGDSETLPCLYTSDEEDNNDINFRLLSS